MVRCPGCRLVQTLDRLSPAELARLYDQEYASAQPAEPRGAELEIMARPLRLALELCPPPAGLLEIGVGQGWLLGQAVEAGYRALGLDLSPQAAALAEQRSGVRVLVGDLSDPDPTDLDLPSQSQDLILMRHSLEHVPKPLPFLRRAAGLLAPGGMIVGAVPNFGSLKRLLDGTRWHFLSLPHHRLHLTRLTLIHLLQKAGLEPGVVVALEHTAHHRMLFQVFLNRIRFILGKNPAPTDYDPGAIRARTPIEWFLAQEKHLHRLLALLGLGEELLFMARVKDPSER